MRLMTYNILNGAVETFEKVISVITSIQPDILVLNEANTFELNDNAKLRELARQADYPHFYLAHCGEYDYHVVMYSRFPFKTIEEIHPLMRAGILAVIETGLGEISIVGTHLTPYTEAERLPEIDLIAQKQSQYTHKILIGDMNSLTQEDGYDESIIATFNEQQMKKFTSDEKLLYDATQKIRSYDYLDSALLFENTELTAPTQINEFGVHSDMRLDYIFISQSLRDKLKRYEVIKNDLSDTASDHYPVVVEIE